MSDPSTVHVLAPEDMVYEEFCKRIAALMKEAIELVDADEVKGSELEQVLRAFISRLKDPSAVQVEVLTSAETPLRAPTPVTPAEAEDPTRPHFGALQIRSTEGLVAGMKLRIRGDPTAQIECYEEEDITVGHILRKTSRSNGVMTIVSSAYCVPPNGRKVLIVSYSGEDFWGTTTTHTSRIFLDDLSVTQHRSAKSGEPGYWRQSAWLERVE